MYLRLAWSLSPLGQGYNDRWATSEAWLYPPMCRLMLGRIARTVRVSTQNRLIKHALSVHLATARCRLYPFFHDETLQKCLLGFFSAKKFRKNEKLLVILSRICENSNNRTQYP